MRTRIYKYNYPHLKDLVHKILYLRGVITLTPGYVVLISKNMMLRFVISVVTLLTIKKLYILDKEEDLTLLKYKTLIGTAN